ncbi:hypothetical protein A0H81_01849 [Grifola frondosa]|uniref:Uncharacterized protein n=1 Tax=Grifola frondosa TaxID=5627 RepID=A0A1C7MME9_GRIFR|nr:hypothetical protein A0H81_01849 [Grifola frondosa]
MIDLKCDCCSSKVPVWKKLAVNVSILVLDIVVLALAARVNIFQEFFFVADLFPLALSIVTLVLLVCFLVLDFGLRNSFTVALGMKSACSTFSAFSGSHSMPFPLPAGALFLSIVLQFPQTIRMSVLGAVMSKLSNPSSGFNSSHYSSPHRSFCDTLLSSTGSDIHIFGARLSRGTTRAIS